MRVYSGSIFSNMRIKLIYSKFNLQNKARIGFLGKLRFIFLFPYFPLNPIGKLIKPINDHIFSLERFCSAI